MTAKGLWIIGVTRLISRPSRNSLIWSAVQQPNLLSWWAQKNSYGGVEASGTRGNIELVVTPLLVLWRRCVADSEFLVAHHRH